MENIDSGPFLVQSPFLSTAATRTGNRDYARTEPQDQERKPSQTTDVLASVARMVSGPRDLALHDRRREDDFTSFAVLRHDARQEILIAELFEYELRL